MPFFSRSKKAQALAASEDKSSALHPSTLPVPRSRSASGAHQQDPRERHALQSQLKEIRLLYLQPGVESEPLCCDLRHTLILSERHLKYETVSYCWGEDPGESSITINGTTVVVTASAVEVLHRMRDPTTVRSIWIDAICINQAFPAEKNAQVAIMADIYRQGSSNFIWLGDVSDAPRILRALESVLQNIDSSNKSPEEFHSLMAGPAGAGIHDGHKLSRGTDWDALKELYDRPYFQRLWVAQEAALAPNSICNFGECSLPLTKILDVAVWLIYNVHCLPKSVNEGAGVYAARAMWYIIDEKDKSSTDLFAAYIMAQNFKATDRRDHVYALRSLYRDRQPALRMGETLLRPDYDDSKSKYDVFRDATLASILDTGHLGILQFVVAESASKTPRTWPSWTLQFDVKTNLDKDPICRIGNEFSADNDTDQYPPYFSMPNTLVAHGIKIDEVAEKSKRFSKARLWATGEHAQLMDDVYDMIRKRRAHLDWIAELATTLIAGSYQNGAHTSRDDFVAFREYSADKQKSKQPPMLEPGKRYDESYVKACRWFSAFELAMYGRRFFMTSRGMPGIGPLAMDDKTDIVAVLCGGTVPFVLRPSKERRGEYSLVGACYVLGIMHGEAAIEQDVERFRIV